MSKLYLVTNLCLLVCLLTTYECHRIYQWEPTPYSYASTMNPREIQNYMTRPPELEILVSKNFRSGEKTVMLSEQEQKLTELARNQTLATLSKLELSELSIIASFLLYLKTQREPEEHIKTVLRQPMLQLLLVIISVILLLVPADECLHIFGSAESKLLKELANVQPSESKLLPFLYKQQSSQSLDDLLTSSPFYNSASSNLSKPPKSSQSLDDLLSSSPFYNLASPNLSKPPKSSQSLDDLLTSSPFYNSASPNLSKPPKSSQSLDDLLTSSPFYNSASPNLSKPPKSSQSLDDLLTSSPFYNSASPNLSKPPKSSQSLDDLLTSSPFYNSASPNLSKPPKSSQSLDDLLTSSPFIIQHLQIYQNHQNHHTSPNLSKPPKSSQSLDDLLTSSPFYNSASPNLSKPPKSSQSLDDLLTSSPFYNSASTNLSKPPKSSIFSKGQESSLYLQKSDSKKLPLLSSLNSNYISEVEVLSSKPPLSDLVVPLDTSFEYQKDGALSNMVPLCRLTLCELKKQLLKEIQSSADDIKDQKLLVRELSTNYKNPDQRLTSRARAKKIKIKEKSDADDSPFAEDWFGSQKSEESLAKKKKPTLKKLKIFSTLKQEMKYKETLKQKVKKVKKAKKIKNYAQGIEPLKNSWRNRENISSRKSKTLRCYNSRKQDDNGSLTVCVTYPKSWGATAPYPYYYPFYYPAYYYYPYYYYGRR
ncbi:hypothetical protein MSG28_008236 [Choristoneura fumiferana]|uniref:Uncharacterized protein n=1 Tax=Choristoneura fumiferana TaxID=7141 RepID=A0ACC0JAN8_CHOFU|nr:hypothetical protein MSG28_008236 [Choristoneura fumiferana]